MKKQIAFILLLALFGKRTWAKTYRTKFVLKLYRQRKLWFDVERVRLRHGYCLELIETTIQRGSGKITCDTISICLQLRTMFNSRTRWRSLQITARNVVVTQQQKERASSPGASDSKNKENYFQTFERLYPFCQKLFDRLHLYFPDQLTAETIIIESGTSTRKIVLRSFDWAAHRFTGVIERIGYQAPGCMFTGQAKNGLLAIEFTLTNTSSKGAAYSFRSLQFQLQRSSGNRDNGCIEVNLSVSDIWLSHRAFATCPILMKSLSIQCFIEYSSQWLRVTGESNGNIDGIPFVFSFSHELADPQIVKFMAYVDLEWVALRDLFFGAFMLSDKNFQATGNLLLQLSLILNLANPYEHFFDVEIVDNQLNIVDVGDFDLMYLNHAFSHHVQKDGKFIETLDLVESDRGFIPLGKMSKYLPPVIIFSEDPNFHAHAGVDVFFIGYAIARNFASHRFSRGASTITMQLARNLFLNHEKNVARKLEEVIIALLIENHFQISKRRLLELYLNIIEFGPKVYGITYAAGYYFNKSPGDLSLLECVIVTYIIPRPVHFDDALNRRSPQLIDNLHHHIHRTLNGLLESQIITKTEFDDTLLSLPPKPSLLEIFSSHRKKTCVTNA